MYIITKIHINVIYQFMYIKNTKYCLVLRPTKTYQIIKKKVMNPLDAQCNRQRNDAICVSQLKNALEIDRGILAEKPDVKIFLPFRFFVYRAEDLFQPNTYNRFLGMYK